MASFPLNDSAIADMWETFQQWTVMSGSQLHQNNKSESWESHVQTYDASCGLEKPSLSLTLTWFCSIFLCNWHWANTSLPWKIKMGKRHTTHKFSLAWPSTPQVRLCLLSWWWSVHLRGLHIPDSRSILQSQAPSKKQRLMQLWRKCWKWPHQRAGMWGTRP